MKIRGKKGLSTYKYLVMFDLASHLTGVCLWDIEKNVPIRTDIINVSTSCESKTSQLYYELQKYFMGLEKNNILKSEILVCKEAMPIQVHGGASTIYTFIALAKSHAMLDFLLENEKIDEYDDVGIYPASTHSYFKRTLGLDAQAKITKKDVNQYVCQKYGFDHLSLDESDAVLLAEVFMNYKWNKDLDEAIKDIKKHIKTLKSISTIQEYNTKIETLKKYKREIQEVQ